MKITVIYISLVLCGLLAIFFGWTQRDIIGLGGNIDTINNSGSTVINQEKITLDDKLIILEQVQNSGSIVDGLKNLENTHPELKTATILASEQDYTGAIMILEKLRSESAKPSEKAIIDFNISSHNFALDRVSGARAFIALAKNPDYPRRTRALAMQRVYLMYRKYLDDDILRAIVTEVGIPWSTREQAISQYMTYSHNMYPLPVTYSYFMNNELKGANTAEDALSIYDKYSGDIITGINFMKQTSGELTEATSSMLGLAITQGNLHIGYDLLTQEIVESSFRELIRFDQEKNLNVNKQFALLYYADFLAGVGDTGGALNMISIVLNEGLQEAIKESLPLSNDFSNLKSMDVSGVQSIQEFIGFIGSKL